MKKLFVSLLLSALALSVSYGELDEKGKRVYENIAESDERGDYTQNILDPFVATSSLVLDAKPYKGEYFVGEVFSVELIAKTTEKTDFEFELDFNKNEFLKFLNPNVKWQKNGDEYTALLYFEAKSVNAELLQIILKLKRNKEVFQQASLNVNPLQFKNVPDDKIYSGIVADELLIEHFKSDYFDDKNLIMVVEFKAQGANLKNFHLKNNKIIEQRVDGLKGDFNSSSAFYSAIFEPSMNELDFSYFNTNTQKLETINLQVEINDEKISTQTDLNPQNNDLDFYKQLFFWVIAGICGAIFAFKRSYIFLGIALIAFAASFFVVQGGTQTGVLKANSKVKILPTTQSTFFYTSQKDVDIEILGKRDNYFKILLPDGKIGWVTSENLQKN